MKGFRLSPEARDDVRETWAWIAQDSVDAAARVRTEILKACRLLAERPGIGHRREDLTTRDDVLFWPVGSYLVIYRPGTTPLDILRVLHGARNVPRLLADR